MSVESAEDRAAMLNPDDFGTTAVLKIGTEAAVELEGIFSDEPVETDLAYEVAGLPSTAPMFTCRTADVPNLVSRGAFLEVNGETFVVIEHRPDGTGISELPLHRTAVP